LWDATGTKVIVCVRFGVPATALAVHDRAIAIGLGRAVTYLVVSDQPEIEC
jgi:hypothetical protein